MRRLNSVQTTFGDIPRSKIRANHGQPRKYFDQDALQELAESIEQNGLLQPITVRPHGLIYQVVAGERRLRALDLLKRDVVPCIILDGVDDEQAFILATTENVARKDMTIIEEAKAYEQIVSLGRNVTEVAALFGKTPTYVQDCIDLLLLREDFQHLVARGQIKNVLASAMTRLSLDGQAEVMSKVTADRFPKYQDAVSYAHAVQMREAQPALLGPLFGDASAAEVARRRRNRRAVEDVMAKLAKLAEAYEELLALDATDIAAAYGPAVLSARDQGQRLYLAANRARQHLNAAAAAHEASNG